MEDSAIELWRTFPHQPTDETGTPMPSSYAPVVLATENTECPCFCEWRCQLPKGVDDHL